MVLHFTFISLSFKKNLSLDSFGTKEVSYHYCVAVKSKYIIFKNWLKHVLSYINGWTGEVEDDDDDDKVKEKFI